MVVDWISEEGPLSALDAFIAAVHEAFGLPASAPDSVVDEVAVATGLVAYGLSRSEGIAAYRWNPTSGGVVEAACLKVSESAVRITVAERLTCPEFDQLRERLTRNVALPLRPAQKRVPGFLNLVALLSGGARVSVGGLEAGQEIFNLKDELDYYKLALRDLSEELRQVRTQLQSSSLMGAAHRIAQRSEDEETAAAPESPSRGWADLPAWCAHHEANIAVMPRALNACKKPLYEEPENVFIALELLAGPYRQLRLGELTKEAFQRALDASGLKLSGSTTPTVAGSQGEEYFVTWRGRRRFLELHLLKGGGRDERYCMRVYFFWCDETRRVVVGSMPAHLSNSLS